MMKTSYNFDRREFLRLTGLAGSGLILSLHSAKSLASNLIFKPNIFIYIPKKGKITLVCHRSEMGQGIRTSIIQLIADELEVPIESVVIKQALGHEKYGDQNTDGSRSISRNWDKLRMMGATARELLKLAGAKRLKVNPKTCEAIQGYVIHKHSGHKFSYQELAEEASRLDHDVKPLLKLPKEFKYIGKDIVGLEAEELTTGKVQYGMDIEIPGMVYVALCRAPVISGKLISFNRRNVLKLPGVLEVFEIERTGVPDNISDSVGVVADNTWSAFEACQKLKIKWDIPKCDISRSDQIKDKFKKVADKESQAKIYREVGRDTTIDNDIQYKSYEYYTSMLCHAPMEPLVATAHVHDNICEIWAPTQSPQKARDTVAKYLGIEKEKVKLNVTFLGGGFGRKSRVDFVLEAVIASKKIKKPVKLVWTREDEIRHGFYHPPAYQKIVVGYNSLGKIKSWEHRSIFTSLKSAFVDEVKELEDWELNLGATPLPFNFPKIKVTGSHVSLPVKVGWLRSVQNIFHSYAINSVMDEFAYQNKIDPILFALKNIGPARIFKYTKDNTQDTSRLIHVIQKVRDISNWEKKLKMGAKLGFAHHFSFNSYLAAVVELDDHSNTHEILIKNVYISIDCGLFVNPNYVRAQIEGSVMFGISIVKYGQISYNNNGVIKEGNFHNYRISRMTESPKVYVDIVKNDNPPAGVGEPGVPVFVPAFTNAISRFLNKRINELPVVLNEKGM